MSSCAAAPPSTDSTDSSTQSLSLTVTGMSCAGCAAGLEKTLRALPGIEDASVNFALSRADLTFHPDTLPASRILSSVTESGYEVPTHTHRLSISGMSCSACAAGVSRALSAVPGVLDTDVNVALDSAEVLAVPDIASDRLIAAVEAAGFGAQLPAVAEDPATPAEASSPWNRLGMQCAIAFVLSAPMVLQMLWMWLGGQAFLAPWVEWLLATPVQFWIGARFYRGALRAIRSKSGNMDVLVATGTTAAYAYSVVMLLSGTAGHFYFESAAVVITLVLLGKWLEARAKHSATAALRDLVALRPQTVNRITEAGEHTVPVGEVVLGDLVRVRPGERIPVDGRIEGGAGEIDESLVTGESMPVLRQPGDTVTGGAMNGNGALDVRVTAVGEDTLLAQVIAIVENAQSGKAPVQRLVDRVSAVFVPVVMGIAVITLVAWLLVGGSFAEALMAAVSVLVIACPCALGLATPTALVAGTGVAARAGILIKDIETLERADQVGRVVFDKTGTLTRGQPDVSRFMPLDGHADTLALTGSLQTLSEHPLGRALVRYAQREGADLVKPKTFTAVAGLGVTGDVGGARVAIGNRALMQDEGIDTAEVDQRVQELEASAGTVACVAVAGEIRALAVFTDPVRPESAAAVTALKGRGCDVSVLSGDASLVTARLADELGLDAWQAEQKPADKANAIAQLRASGAVVAMVGDGINDAPALASSDVGIAMGGGTDAAIASAGVTLLRQDPRLVAAALDIAQATRRKIWQNLFWAFIYNLIGLPLAAFGLLTPALAGAAMALSSVSVVSNALLLKRWRPDMDDTIARQQSS